MLATPEAENSLQILVQALQNSHVLLYGLDEFACRYEMLASAICFA